MKRIIASVALAALALATSLGSTGARADDALDAQIKAAYAHQCDLLKNGDLDGFGKTLADDFVNVDADGKKQTREENMAEMKQGLQGVDISDCSLTLVSASRSGDDVAASVVFSQDGTAFGSPIGVVTRENDVWTQKDGTWLCKMSTQLEQTITVSGKIYRHTGSPAATPAP